MKQLFYTLITSLLLMSCSEPAAHPETSMPLPTTTGSNTTATPATEATPLRVHFSQPAQQFTVSSHKKTLLLAKKGLKILVDPSNLETENGLPPGDKIDVHIKELVNQADLFKNDAPTVSNGRLLVSGGAYYIGMSSDGNTLRLKKNRSLRMDIPRRSDKSMELFYGVSDSTGTLNWLPAGESLQETAATIPNKKKDAPGTVEKPQAKTSAVNIVDDTSDIERLIAYAEKKGNVLSIKEWDSLLKYTRTNENSGDYSTTLQQIVDTATGAQQVVVESAYYKPVEIKNLGWINCDRFYNSPQNTDIRCKMDSLLNTNIIAAYFIYTNINSVQKEYLQQEGKTVFKSFSNRFPVGEPVKMIAIANVNGQFYRAEKQLNLTKGVTLTLNFKKVDNADIIRDSFQYQ